MISEVWCGFVAVKLSASEYCAFRKSEDDKRIKGHSTMCSESSVVVMSLLNLDGVQCVVGMVMDVLGIRALISLFQGGGASVATVHFFS